MGVLVRNIMCLSMSKDEERYYPVKAFIGDNVRLFFEDRKYVDGIINSISDTDITLKVKSPNGSEKLSRYKTNKITGFNVYFRGQKIRNMIG